MILDQKINQTDYTNIVYNILFNLFEYWTSRNIKSEDVFWRFYSVTCFHGLTIPHFTASADRTGIQIYGSIFLPTQQLLRRMREKPWNGVKVELKGHGKNQRWHQQKLIVTSWPLIHIYIYIYIYIYMYSHWKLSLDLYTFIGFKYLHWV